MNTVARGNMPAVAGGSVANSNIEPENTITTVSNELKERHIAVFKGDWEASYVNKTIKSANLEDVSLEVDPSKCVVLPSNFLYAKTNPKGADVRLRTEGVLNLTKGKGGIDVSKDEHILACVIAFRDFIMLVAEPHVVSYFCKQLKAACPDLTLADGRAIASFDDFKMCLRTAPANNKTRAIYSHAVHGIWGPSNTWALDFERKVMALVGIVYSQDKTQEVARESAKMAKRGDKPITRTKNHPGGFVKELLVDKKTRKVEAVKKLCLDLFGHAVYTRTPTKKIASKLVVMVVKADRLTDGVDGAIGCAASHPKAHIEPPVGKFLWKRDSHKISNDGIPDTPSKAPMLECLNQLESPPKTPHEMITWCQDLIEKGPPDIARKPTAGNGWMQWHSPPEQGLNLLSPHRESDSSTDSSSMIERHKKKRSAEEQLPFAPKTLDFSSTALRFQLQPRRQQEQQHHQVVGNLETFTTRARTVVEDQMEVTEETQDPSGSIDNFDYPFSLSMKENENPNEESRDPDKLLGEECTYNHLDIANFCEYSKTYFTEKQREKHPEWPENCSRCKKSFWSDPVLMLKGSKSNKFCPGALSGNCSYCFCDVCFTHKLQKGDHISIAPPTPEKDGRVDGANSFVHCAASDDAATRSSGRKRVKKTWNED